MTEQLTEVLRRIVEDMMDVQGPPDFESVLDAAVAEGAITLEEAESDVMFATVERVIERVAYGIKP